MRQRSAMEGNNNCSEEFKLPSIEGNNYTTKSQQRNLKDSRSYYGSISGERGYRNKTRLPDINNNKRKYACTITFS